MCSAGCAAACLQVLPFRASIGHHDAHHKYSNHALRAKNYGETFWIWDALIGTRSPLHGCAQATHSGKAL
jgi:sterol desaturase/sphingolipid hydroxylase (fatty acid hydroxylase superfamily)